MTFKGPIVARWLYDDRFERRYLDLDILVDPAHFPQARLVLQECGFTDVQAGVRDREVAPHARDFLRGSSSVDLHRHIPGLDVLGDQAAFEVLIERSEQVMFPSGPLVAPDQAAGALIAAATVISSVGGNLQPLVDLDRVVDRLSAPDWADVVALATQLGALETLSRGLRTLVRGAEIADLLGLPALNPPTLAPDLFVLQLERLRALPTLRAKASLVFVELFPSRAFLRYSSPVARRGWMGLLVAYLQRPFVLAARTLRLLGRRRRDGGSRKGGRPEL